MTEEMAAHSNSRVEELFRDGGAKGYDDGDGDGAGGAHSTESAPSHEPTRWRGEKTWSDNNEKIKGRSFSKAVWKTQKYMNKERKERGPCSPDALLAASTA
ncbi:hypothetical protein QJS10_CPB11g01078 [Acorus calamus]|uniref:Uncharacterized protein n=1 Tax=Acorus calamus TaxID=4465 RepID=A0AAV9DT34_ACOCL|nr:hypothetical protein QJS10_CPB11g01078 [Acorus calamus]